MTLDSIRNSCGVGPKATFCSAVDTLHCGIMTVWCVWVAKVWERQRSTLHWWSARYESHLRPHRAPCQLYRQTIRYETHHTNAYQWSLASTASTRGHNIYVVLSKFTIVSSFFLYLSEILLTKNRSHWTHDPKDPFQFVLDSWDGCTWCLFK